MGVSEVSKLIGLGPDRPIAYQYVRNAQVVIFYGTKSMTSDVIWNILAVKVSFRTWLSCQWQRVRCVTDSLM